MSEPGTFPVRLDLADADHLLALAEWGLRTGALSSLGPGLHWAGVERAARKIEAVADMARQGMEIE